MTFIPRNIYPDIKKHLKNKEITLLIGPRQVGKTTILKKLQQELIDTGTPTVYWNIDNFEDRAYFSTQNTLIERLNFLVGKKPATVFIDEIQRLEDAGLFLKGLYDMNTPHKFVVTGSGSLELKANIIEHMTGRKRVFSISPITFTEFVCHRAGIQKEQWTEFFTIEYSHARRLFEEYTLFGGYPKVILADSRDEKMNQLQELYSSYIDKDVQALLGVEKDVAYQQLVQYLAGTIGSMINRAEIARTVNITEKTVALYLDYLEKTFIIQIVRPFYRNTTKELTKSPRVYFVDIGLRNYVAQSFQEFDRRLDKGAVFENFIFSRLQELSLPFPVKWWRSHQGHEVDFIMEQKGEPIPVEVKSALKAKKGVPKGLTTFIKEYSPSHAYWYTIQSNIEQYADNSIQRLPYYALPLTDA